MSDELANQILTACHLEGEFTLRSGEISTEYFDKYLFESNPFLLGRIAEEMQQILPPCDALGGMEMGGIPLVTALSQRTGLPAVFVRKVAKPYGTCKAVEGIPVAGLRVVAVEDVVTTAGALVAGCEHLRAAGAAVEIAICAIDREEGGTAALGAIGVELRSVLNRADLNSVTR